MHGGAAPQVRKAAERRLARERLQGDLGKLLAELELEAADRRPEELLLDSVHRCNAMVRVLAELVGRIQLGTSSAIELPVLEEMYGKWIDRATRASKLALDAGISDRLVRLEEARAHVIADAFREFARLLGHNPADEPVRKAARAALMTVREVPGNKAPAQRTRALSA
jgi:hypothetical protein